jgi:Domain of unknown function (DUF1905)/Bacteriocin-protection, YdeI or OmpD-Associated
MIKFSTPILRFDKKGEKTGWSYIEFSARQAQKLNPSSKVSFRIKGTLDNHPIKQTALLPMGEGSFILPFNARLRKATGKKTGDKILVNVELDQDKFVLSPDLMICLDMDPASMKFFKSLPGSHQKYYSNWIESAKTQETKAKRIAMAMIAFSKKQGFSEMMREKKKNLF